MAVSVVNHWSGTWSIPPLFAHSWSTGHPITIRTANSDGNWLIALATWTSPGEFATTISFGDDGNNRWEPLGAPAGTSSPAGNTRAAIWAAPYAAPAGTVYPSPSGYTPGLSVLVVEISGMAPGLALEAIQTSWINNGTTLSLSLPAAGQQVITLACAGQDSNTPVLTLTGGGWTALPNVVASNGSDHSGDCTMVSGWQVTSSAVTATWTASASTDIGACAVALAVTQPAPAGPSQDVPLIQWQAAFGAGIGTPWDQLEWTDITARWRSFSGTRGKQYELDSVQAASMQSVLSNNDGALYQDNPASPYYQGVTPWTGVNGASLFLSPAYAWTGAKSMLLTPDGVSSLPAAQSEQVPVTAGSAYSGFAATICPAGWSPGVQTALNWYTISGSLISTTYGTPVPASAGEWVYPQVTGTAPAGAVFASLDLQVSGAPPSTTLTWWDYCLLTSPAGMVLNTNWGFSSGAQVFTPVRQLVTWMGRTSVQFRGNMERWPQSMDAARYSQSGGELTDVWSDLTTLLPTVIRGEILIDEPWGYWPCGDAAGSTTAANVAPTSTGPLTVTESKYGAGSGGTQAFGALSGAISGDPSGTVWQQSGLASGAADITHGFCLQYAAAETPPISGGLTIEAWVLYTGAQPNGKLIIWALQGSSGTIAELYGDYDGSGAGIGWYLSVTDKTTKVATTTRVFPFGLGALSGWSYWAVTLTPTSWTVFIDGGAFGSVSGTANLQDQWQWITWGGSADKVSTGGSSNIALAHLAVYPRVLASNRFTARFFAGGQPGFGITGGLGGDPGDDRINRLLGYANALVPRRLSSAPETMQPGLDINGQAASQDITNIAQSDSGLLYIDRCGYLAYSSRQARWNLPVQWTIGEQAGAILNANWDFEAGVTPWTAGPGGVTIAASTAAAFAGTSSMLVTPSGANTSAISEVVAVTGSTLYTATAMLMAPAGWITGGRLQVSWYTGPGLTGFISTTSGSPVVLPAGQWVQVTLTATAPPGAAYATFGMSLAGAISSATPYYADLAQLTQPGEIPYLGDIAFEDDPSLVFNDITLLQYLGTTVAISSATSMAQYGDETLQETIYQTDTSLVTDLANWLLANYSFPAPRAATVTVDAASNPYAWQFLLSADIGTIVTINRRLGGTEQVVGGTFVIQSITPAQAAGVFRATYSATPYLGNVLATNDPVHGCPDGSNALAW